MSLQQKIFDAWNQYAPDPENTVEFSQWTKLWAEVDFQNYLDGEKRSVEIYQMFEEFADPVVALTDPNNYIRRYAELYIANKNKLS